MDKERLEKLAKDPSFISGIYNYCDRWCERCPLTSRCMNYTLSEDEFNSPESKDITNQVFWDTLHGVFQSTLEMVKETAEEMGIDLSAIDHEEYAEQEELLHKMVKNQPHSKAAFVYVDMVNKWFNSNEELLKNKAEDMLTLVQAEIPGTKIDEDALKIQDCLEIVRWYQHQIYVKLCRATSGLIRGELKDGEYFPEDANGSSKVVIIGIERSIAAWGGLLQQFPEQENSILDLLVFLKKLLRQVDAAFPCARAFIRPGFDERKN
ncbi:MAG: hypothetical protein ACYS3S_23725 [Planctomycetota bacterium]